ncbi:hypothetical protein EON65_38480 [archaeon]|nr:MAG: hypothetical protein EON65_38480 [archaeon]
MLFVSAAISRFNALKEFRTHSETLVMKLRREYADGAAAIGGLMPTVDNGKYYVSQDFDFTHINFCYFLLL